MSEIMPVLSPEEIDREHNNWCMRRGKENLKMSWRQWIAQTQNKADRKWMVEWMKENGARFCSDEMEAIGHGGFYELDWSTYEALKESIDE